MTDVVRKQGRKATHFRPTRLCSILLNSALPILVQSLEIHRQLLFSCGSVLARRLFSGCFCCVKFDVTYMHIHITQAAQ